MSHPMMIIEYEYIFTVLPISQLVKKHLESSVDSQNPHPFCMDICVLEGIPSYLLKNRIILVSLFSLIFLSTSMTSWLKSVWYRK